jgi:hypothetical protein
LQVYRRHLPAGPAEEDEVAAGSQGVEALIEGVLAYAVVDDVDALATGDVFRLFGEVLLSVQDHLVRPGAFGELRLLLGRDGTDGARPAQLRELAQKEPDPARRRVDERGLALL